MMSLDASDVLHRLSAFLEARGYLIAMPPPPPPARMLATRRGHSLGIFLPFTDYIVGYELDSAAARDPIAFEKLHTVGIEYADSQTRTPRVLRYRVPNVVTVGVTDVTPSDSLIEVATRVRLRSQLDGGGLKDSTYIFDIATGTFHGTAIEETPGRYGATTTTSVNPTNRVRRMMDEFARELFGR
jgi:hypothetical protein